MLRINIGVKCADFQCKVFDVFNFQGDKTRPSTYLPLSVDILCQDHTCVFPGRKSYMYPCFRRERLCTGIQQRDEGETCNKYWEGGSICVIGPMNQTLSLELSYRISFKKHINVNS